MVNFLDAVPKICCCIEDNQILNNVNMSKSEEDNTLPDNTKYDSAAVNDQTDVIGHNETSEVVKTHETVQPSGESETETQGWLYKRTKGMFGMSCKWEKQWFNLNGTDLVYGKNEQMRNISYF